jgi:hypothetical protein
MVAYAQELRNTAAHCRRAANIPTSGSTDADRALVILADRLERDAAFRERLPQGDKNPGGGIDPDAHREALRDREQSVTSEGATTPLAGSSDRYQQSR